MSPSVNVLDDPALNVAIVQPIPEAIRLLIISNLWGPIASFNAQADDSVLKWRSSILSTYFDNYYRVATASTTLPGHRGLKTHKELLFFISLLKMNPTSPRRDLRQACQLLSEGKTVDAAMAIIPTTALPVIAPLPAGERRIDIDTALAVAVKTMLILNISPAFRPNEYTIAAGQSNTIWEEADTLAQLIDSNFPKATIPPATPEYPIELGNLRARTLKDHYAIELEWTRHFPDHLELSIGTKSKTLKVFELASVLEVSCSATNGQTTHLSTPESLKLGCYPPALLHETQRTFELLFPARDWSWLQKEISPRSSYIGRKRPGRDSRLSSVASSIEGSRNHVDPRSITNAIQLFENFPYWTPQLRIILKEVDSPTPLSWFGKWSERRKAARHAFRLTYVGVVIAVLFGMAATGLAAVSVWISYCDWQGNISWACEASKDETPSATPSTN